MYNVCFICEASFHECMMLFMSFGLATHTQLVFFLFYALQNTDPAYNQVIIFAHCYIYYSLEITVFFFDSLLTVTTF